MKLGNSCNLAFPELILTTADFIFSLSIFFSKNRKVYVGNACVWCKALRIVQTCANLKETNNQSQHDFSTE